MSRYLEPIPSIYPQTGIQNDIRVSKLNQNDQISRITIENPRVQVSNLRVQDSNLRIQASTPNPAIPGLSASPGWAA